MATVTGQRDTLNISSDQPEIEMGDTIALLEPSASPLTLLSKRAGKKRVGNPKFQWLEDAREPRVDAINAGAGYNTTATDLVVDNGAYFAEHYIVQNTRTGENVRVESVATNTITVKRGTGGTTAAAMNDNDELLILGIAQPEGDTSRPARSSNPSTLLNYTQIVREPWDLTNTARSSNNQVEPHDWNHQANKHGIEHAVDIESAFLWGGAGVDTSAAHPRRQTKGAVKFIVTNVTAAGGTLTETTFGTFMRTIFQYGSGNKVLFAAPIVVSALNNFAQGKLNTRQGESTYGLAVQDYISPFGTLSVMTHWLLAQSSKYNGYALALDFDQIKYAYLGGGVGGDRDTHIATNIQENDRDGRKDEYRSECGLQFGLEKRHGVLTGVTG